MSTQADRILRVVNRMFDTEPPSQPLPNARRFVGERFDHSEHPLLVHQGGLFYAWDGTCWPALDDADLRAQLYAYFEHATYIGEEGNRKPFAPNRYKVADLIDALRAVAHVPVSTTSPSWLANGSLPADELIACSNGLVHYPTRGLHPHTPTFYAHHSVPFAFDPDAAAPVRWHAFLRDLWGDDKESISTLQELFGYLVSGDTRQQKMFLIVGPKRSGKGTIARVARAMLGAHNVAGPTLASIGTNFGLSPLIGRPVAIIADARLKTSDTSIVTERLLSISGEDTLTVDRKYREPWTGQLPSRIIVLSNELPRLTDSSGALASRFIVLTLSQSFFGREDPALTSALCTELPGIFNWSLDGLELLRERGRFNQPAASQDAIRELEDLGSPVGAFIRDECVIGAEHSVLIDELYKAWQAWCNEHGRRAGSAQVFGRDLRAAFPGIKRTRPRDEGGGRVPSYQGVGLRCPDNTLPWAATHRDPDRHPDDLGRAGSRPTPMYSQRCPHCDGEGCHWCSE